MTSPVLTIVGEELVDALHSVSIQDQEGKVQTKVEMQQVLSGDHGGVCAICLNKINLQETALVKGCEHAYCVNCILQWASYSQKQACKCPQCKHPFEFLNVHRTLDGSIQDVMFEESVCLLLRASWFKPLIVEDQQEEAYDDYEEDYLTYEDKEDEIEEVYFGRSSASLRIGNRRWGDNGYVRGGRQEARLVCRTSVQELSGSSSHEPKKKEAINDKTGRRAKRALKREAADKAAAAKHLEHLARLGRK